MLTEDGLAAIESRVNGATPTPEEPTPYKEVWMIEHLMDIIRSYRYDVPALCAEVRRLQAEILNARVAALEETAQEFEASVSDLWSNQQVADRLRELAFIKHGVHASQQRHAADLLPSVANG